MTRILLALALLAASASPALAGEPSIATSDCEPGTEVGSIEIWGMSEEHQTIVEPGNRVYEEDGVYPLGLGDYTAYVVIPGVEYVAIVPFTIDCPKEPAADPPAAPRATMPPTSTAPPPAIGGEDILLRAVIFLVAASGAAYLVLATRPQR